MTCIVTYLSHSSQPDYALESQVRLVCSSYTIRCGSGPIIDVKDQIQAIKECLKRILTLHLSESKCC